MRNAFANAFYELAKNDRRMYLVVADITAAAGVASFQKESPERFLNVGVAEQMMIGMCAGLALRGCIPFAYTIATFTFFFQAEDGIRDLIVTGVQTCALPI